MSIAASSVVGFMISLKVGRLPKAAMSEGHPCHGPSRVASRLQNCPFRAASRDLHITSHARIGAGNQLWNVALQRDCGQDIFTNDNSKLIHTRNFQTDQRPCRGYPRMDLSG